MHWGSDPIAGAYQVLCQLINPMIEGVHFHLAIQQFDDNGRVMEGAPLGLDLSVHTPLEAIYWTLAEWMGGKFRRCKRCSHLFAFTGKRLYCSLRCMNSQKCQSYRMRVKK